MGYRGPGEVARSFGPRHPSVQLLRRLSGRRAARSEHGAFVIDGPVLVREALAAGVAVREAFVVPDSPAELVDALFASGVRVHSVTPRCWPGPSTPSRPTAWQIGRAHV